MCVRRGGTGVEDVLPLSSRYLVSSTSGSVSGAQQKPDAATLAAENHALRDASEQQHFKLKVSSPSVIIASSLAFTVPTHPAKSWNLRKEFSRPGKSWKMIVVMESHGIPPISHKML